MSCCYQNTSGQVETRVLCTPETTYHLSEVTSLTNSTQPVPLQPCKYALLSQTHVGIPKLSKLFTSFCYEHYWPENVAKVLSWIYSRVKCNWLSTWLKKCRIIKILLILLRWKCLHFQLMNGQTLFISHFHKSIELISVMLSTWVRTLWWLGSGQLGNYFCSFDEWICNESIDILTSPVTVH